MIYWPVTSAVVGISINFFFLSMLSVFTFYKLLFNLNETTEEITEDLLKETFKDVDNDEAFNEDDQNSTPDSTFNSLD